MIRAKGQQTEEDVGSLLFWTRPLNTMAAEDSHKILVIRREKDVLSAQKGRNQYARRHSGDINCQEKRTTFGSKSGEHSGGDMSLS